MRLCKKVLLSSYALLSVYRSTFWIQYTVSIYPRFCYSRFHAGFFVVSFEKISDARVYQQGSTRVDPYVHIQVSYIYTYFLTSSFFL